MRSRYFEKYLENYPIRCVHSGRLLQDYDDDLEHCFEYGVETGRILEQNESHETSWRDREVYKQLLKYMKGMELLPEQAVKLVHTFMEIYKEQYELNNQPLD